MVRKSHANKKSHASSRAARGRGKPRAIKPKPTVRQEKRVERRVVEAKKGPFTTIGDTVGGFIGGPIGAGISGLGSLIGRITGMGDYKVAKNTLMTDNGPPMFNHEKGLRIRHRECLGDVVSSVNFAITAYPINPGLQGTFPWLSTVAKSFESYQFHGLIFEFKSTSADALNSTNTALGTMALSTEYNVQRPNFADKTAMEDYEFTTSCAPSVSMIHPVECKPRLRVLARQYIRTTDLTVANDSILDYDMGRTQLASVGVQQASTVGELWVSYDVELFIPRLNNTTGANANVACHLSTNGQNTGTWAATQPSAAGLNAPFGTSPDPSTFMIYNTAGAILDAYDTTTSQCRIFLPFKGRYMLVSYVTTGGLMTNGLYTCTGLGAGCAAVNSFGRDTSASQGATGSVTGLHVRTFDVLNNAASLNTANTVSMAFNVYSGSQKSDVQVDVMIVSMPTTFQSRLGVQEAKESVEQEFLYKMFCRRMAADRAQASSVGRSADVVVQESKQVSIPAGPTTGSSSCSRFLERDKMLQERDKIHDIPINQLDRFDSEWRAKGGSYMDPDYQTAAVQWWAALCDKRTGSSPPNSASLPTDRR